MTATSARVSAVICTRNRPESILQAVSSVLANDYPAFDLTIVDQSTDDATQQALETVLSDPRLHYIHTERPGLSRAYNIAVQRTDGEYLAFTDDDCIVPADWLSAIARSFDEDPQGDLLYGQVVPLHTDAENRRLTPHLVFDRAERLSRRDGFRVYGMGANFAARRRLFRKVGLFDEALGGGGPLRSSQDYDLAYRTYRAGSVILLRPEVSIRHDGRREGPDWPSLLTNYGFGDGAFYAKHVRCGDLYALWLFAKQLGVVGARSFLNSIRLRRRSLDPYLRGMLEGVRAAGRFDVDRRERLYRIGNIPEVGAGG